MASLDSRPRAQIAIEAALPEISGRLCDRRGLPGGGAVGDQRSDRKDDLFEVLASPGPALQRPPVFAVGDAVFDTIRSRALIFVNLIVFVFFLPDTNARRPGVVGLGTAPD
jgi:hypothetical protein